MKTTCEFCLDEIELDDAFKHSATCGSSKEEIYIPMPERFFQELSNYMRHHALPNGYFRYEITVLQTEEGKEFSYFGEKLKKITEKEAHDRSE